MQQQRSEQHAIVLTGSGTNAAYEVGVLQALLNSAYDDRRGAPPITPYCVSGTSMGALNAALLLSSEGVVDAVQQVWVDDIAVETASSATGMFRIRAEPTQYLSQLMRTLDGPLDSAADLMRDMFFFVRETAGRLFVAMTEEGTLADRAAKITELNQWIDIAPLLSLLNRHVNPDRLRTSPTKVAITALDWRTGQPRTFTNRELGSHQGRAAVLAALAMPGIMPPPRVDGRLYVDAGVLMDTPLKPALDRRNPGGGPVVLHIVYVDASAAELPIAAVSNTFATVYRLLMLALSRLVAIDLIRAQSINRQLFMKQALENAVAAVAGQSATPDEDTVAHVLGFEAGITWDELTKHTKEKVPVTVHKYRPTRNIHGFDLAQFERDTIIGLIDDGCEDALNHDCNVNGCIKAP